MKQGIDTDVVFYTADSLRRINKEIQNSFDSMERETRRLGRDWSGRGADAALDVLHKVLSANTARFTVIQNYVTMLEQKVAPDYITTEEVNKSLADKFM